MSGEQTSLETSFVRSMGLVGGVCWLGFQLWDAGWLRMLKCESVSAWRAVYRPTGFSLLSFLESCSTGYLQQTPTPPSQELGNPRNGEKGESSVLSVKTRLCDLSLPSSV